MNKLLAYFDFLFHAVKRFWATTCFLVIAVILNGYYIETENTNPHYFLLTLYICALGCCVAQMMYEQILSQTKINQILSAACAIFVGFLYYLLISSGTPNDDVTGVRTAVFVFCSLMAYLFMGSLKSLCTYEQIWLSAFKSFFIALLFCFVSFMGVSLTVMAINQLLFPIGEQINLHAANVIFLLFGILYFFAMTPRYDKRSLDNKSQQEYRQRSTSCPKLLEILISYIIIPITCAFTVIIILYIILNIGKHFWKDNLLEPMLISYTIAVILVYLLASNLTNKVTTLFVKIFPNFLLLIGIFQTTASILKATQVGITFGRYYVILYGGFSIFAGVLFCFKKKQRYNLIGAVLIGCCVISVFPLTDAFRLAKISQTQLLKSTLEKNQMLKDSGIIPKDSISEKDKEQITSSYNYLFRLNQTKDISWLKDTNNMGFSEIFGFNQSAYDPTQSIYVAGSIKNAQTLNIEDYDQYIGFELLFDTSDNKSKTIATFEKNKKRYTLKTTHKENQTLLIIEETLLEKATDKDKSVVWEFDFQKARDACESAKNESVSVEDLTFTGDSKEMELTLILQHFELSKGYDYYHLQTNAQIFIRYKN